MVWGIIPGGAQYIQLALCSEINLGSDHETICGVGLHMNMGYRSARQASFLLGYFYDSFTFWKTYLLFYTIKLFLSKELYYVTEL